MNISKQIVDLHKGVIDYHSELGVGTTFMVAFDTIPAPETAEATAPRERKPWTDPAASGFAASAGA